MIEVVAAVSAASSAFSAIKKGFEVGRDIESMAGDMGRWWPWPTLRLQGGGSEIRRRKTARIPWIKGPGPRVAPWNTL